jgi:hypothetical protein
MYIDIIKGIVLSFVLILIIHNLYLFFQKTLTIPKTKDLVNKPGAKYAEILKTLTNMDVEVEKSGTTSISQLNNTTLGNLLPENLGANTQIPNQLSHNSSSNNETNNDSTNMKSELRDFLTSLGTNATTTTNATGEKKTAVAYETNNFSAY